MKFEEFDDSLTRCFDSDCVPLEAGTERIKKWDVCIKIQGRLVNIDSVVLDEKHKAFVIEPKLVIK